MSHTGNSLAEATDENFFFSDSVMTELVAPLPIDDVLPQDNMGGMLGFSAICLPANSSVWYMVAISQNKAADGSAHPNTRQASEIHKLQ